jgi:hypothetical protein
MYDKVQNELIKLPKVLKALEESVSEIRQTMNTESPALDILKEIDSDKSRKEQLQGYRNSLAEIRKEFDKWVARFNGLQSPTVGALRPFKENLGDRIAGLSQKLRLAVIAAKWPEEYKAWDDITKGVTGLLNSKKLPGEKVVDIDAALRRIQQQKDRIQSFVPIFCNTSTGRPEDVEITNLWNSLRKHEGTLNKMRAKLIRVQQQVEQRQERKVPASRRLLELNFGEGSQAPDWSQHQRGGFHQ